MSTNTTKAGPLAQGPASCTAQSVATTSIPLRTVPGWAATALEHAHALVVNRGEGRTRRHVYLSLPAAEKAAAAARDRGHQATVVLVRLVVEVTP